MNAISPAIAERAVEWMVELQSPPVTAQTVVDWQRWRAENPEHERAWQRIEAFGERLAIAAEHAGVAQTTLASLSPAGGIERRQVFKALALLVGVGSVAWAGRNSSTWQNLSADYRSAVGEQRRLTLADGTRVMLNTDSAIDVHFDAHTRLLRLLRGEVQIRTASDPQARPFWAHTQQGSVHSHSSSFLLRQSKGLGSVAVSAGQLTLHAGLQAPLTLQAGQKVLFSERQIGPVRALSEADGAWADGMLIANDQRLQDFLAEVSRYRPGHLGCSSEVADLRVAGTYPLADTDKILQTLGTTLNLEVRRFTPYWVSLEGRTRRV
ncbi:FecR domain-containing protein [Pseudomonas cremoricolorata]|uniref:FecR domain-containing protein n=1 Tax=Pseudomonas cremoricolorata TaxID=157783 RepID=UPI0003F4F061|nr:FecR domain-containing protein [Pseudomonas cremoricolorata]